MNAQEFAKLLFQHCEALRPLSGKYNELFEYFRSWKGTIPTAGVVSRKSCDFGSIAHLCLSPVLLGIGYQLVL